MSSFCDHGTFIGSFSSLALSFILWHLLPLDIEVCSNSWVSALQFLFLSYFHYVYEHIIFMFPIHFDTEGEMEKERSLSSLCCHSKELQDNETKAKPSKVLLKCTSREERASQKRHGPRNSRVWVYIHFFFWVGPWIMTFERQAWII